MKLVTWSRDPKAHPHPFHYHRKNAEPLAAHLWLSRLHRLHHPTDLGVVDTQLDDNGDEYASHFSFGRLQVATFTHKSSNVVVDDDDGSDDDNSSDSSSNGRAVLAVDEYLAWKRRWMFAAPHKALVRVILTAAGVSVENATPALCDSLHTAFMAASDFSTWEGIEEPMPASQRAEKDDGRRRRRLRTTAQPLRQPPLLGRR